MIELNKIYNEDCLETMSRMEDGSVDLVLTDPPYNLGREYDGSYNDNMVDYESWCRKWFVEMRRVGKTSVFSVGVKNLPMWYNIEPPQWIYMWFKGNNMGSGSKYTNIGIWEPFLIYGEPKRLGVDGKYLPIVPQKDASFHDCPKPLKLIKGLVVDFTIPGQIIFDGFSGSGTTALACLHTGRNFIGSEISEKYFRLANERIERFKAQGSLALSNQT